MRIAHTTRLVSRLNGGVFFAQVGLLAELCRQGAPEDRFELFGGVEGREKTDEAFWGEVPVHPCENRGPKALGWLAGLEAKLARFGPDLVHCHGLWAYHSWVSGRLCGKAGIPSIVSPHGMLDPWALSLSRLKKRLAWFLFEGGHLANATALHALNEAEAEAIRRLGLDTPIVVVPNGVALPPPDIAPARRNKTLLFLGRLHPKKGLLPLIEAWCALSASAEGTFGWTLQIAGIDEGGFENELRKQVSVSGSPSSISFLGPLWGAAKQKALAESSAFVLPSYSEGLPMAVLEAWAHGKPVLMSRACNLPEGFSEGAAWEVEPSAPRLYSALRSFFSASEAELDQAGAAGRALVEHRFSWHAVARNMLRVYAAAAARQPLPSDLIYRS